MRKKTAAPEIATHVTVGPMWHDGLGQDVEVIGQWLPGYMPAMSAFGSGPRDAVLIRVGTILRLASASALSAPHTTVSD